MKNFDLTKVSQEQYEDHAVKFIQRTGARTVKQWEKESVDLMKSNSTKAYARYAKKAGIAILENDKDVPRELHLPYELRLRLAVVAVIMSVSCKTPQELKAFQPQLIIFCQKMYEERKK